MTAAQLFGAATATHSEILTEIGQGNFDTLRRWLAKNVHQLGSSLSTDQVIERATGRKLDTSAFKHHLAVRYLGGDNPSTGH
jgi:carboxypeptidase Taq